MAMKITAELKKNNWLNVPGSILLKNLEENNAVASLFISSIGGMDIFLKKMACVISVA